MASIQLTQTQARRFVLAHQGLWPPYQLEGKEGILDFIRRVGCIQFDPINIVGQNAELVLQSRVRDFQPGLLGELLYHDRLLLDGWDKNMSIYAVEDWPAFSRVRQRFHQRLTGRNADIQAILPQVRAELEKRGPLSSLDLDFKQSVDWFWAPTRLARAALESMYFWGELAIHHKINTRRVYDFARRLLPPELLSAPDPNPSEPDYQDWYVQRRTGGLGLLANRSGDAWLGMPAFDKDVRQAALERLLAHQQVVTAQVEGLKLPLYLRAQDLPTLEAALNAGDPTPQAAILAPLDNLLWDRRLLKELFGFDYRWEVYKPEVERRYGYYVLPVLYGDRFVARFEPGREKKNAPLLIKQWWWEPDVVPTEAMQSAIQDAFQRFLAFLGKDWMRVEPLALETASLNFF